MNTTITNSGFTATINSKGAELISLKDITETEFIWEGNPEFWGKHSPVLFPIVGTLKNNQYLYDGKTYKLSRHGFARDAEFKIINQSENTVTFSLTQSDETLKVYPFRFELQLKYTIESSKLLLEYFVKNYGTSEMPFSLGAHPAFALPGNFNEYSLFFEDIDQLEYHLLKDDLIAEQIAKLKLENSSLTLDYALFENDALIFKNVKSKSVTIRKKEKALVKIEFSDFPDLGIWTKVGAEFLCIEPWFGYSDSENSNENIMQKDGIQILNPQSEFKAQFTISIL